MQPPLEPTPWRNSLRHRTSTPVSEIGRMTAGERAVKAATDVVDGAAKNASEASRKWAVSRELVKYHLKKMDDLGLVPSISGRRSSSSSTGADTPVSISSAISSTPGSDTSKSSNGSEADEWERYRSAYVYAGLMCAQHGKREAARLTREKFPGVRISDSTALRASRTPHVPPERRPGRQLIIPREIEHKLEDLVLALREMSLPCFRFMVIKYVNALIQGTAYAELLKHKEIRRHWYYNWLGRSKRLTTANLRPLEVTRAQWATPANIEKHYDMLADLMVQLQLAIPHPSYDPKVRCSERLIITKPERIASMDETRLTNDMTEKKRGKRNRSVVAAQTGKYREGQTEHLANKGGGDGTAIGGSTADGKDLPPFFIFSKDIIHKGDINPACIPQCRRADPRDPSKLLPTRFWANEKGGVTGDLGVRYVRGCVEPAMPDLSPENPGLLIMDGHGSHFTLELITYCRSIGLHVVLRPPHTTHILQGEDVVHFATFKDMYHQEKLLKLGNRLLFQGRYRLTVADLLDVARAPWHASFSQKACLQAWEEIGVVPFTQSVLWDLRDQMAKREVVAKAASIDPKFLTVQGMVRIMFSGDADTGAPSSDIAPGQRATGGKRQRDSNTLHSCDLWDCPGGVTADAAFEKIKAKTEERRAKAAATQRRKTARRAAQQNKRAASNELGSRVVRTLVHDAQIPKLTKPLLEAAIVFRGETLAKGAKKAELVQQLRRNLTLPSDGQPPPFSLLPAEDDASGNAAAPSAAADSWEGEASVDEGEAESEESEVGDSLCSDDDVVSE